jgi:hypothetical protein
MFGGKEVASLFKKRQIWRGLKNEQDLHLYRGNMEHRDDESVGKKSLTSLKGLFRRRKHAVEYSGKAQLEEMEDVDSARLNKLKQRRKRTSISMAASSYDLHQEAEIGDQYKWWTGAAMYGIVLF